MWNVITTECFDEWFDTQSEDLQDEILSVLQILKEVGPNLGRPYVDTLKGSKYPNMKELRVQFAGEPIRAFSLLIQTEWPLCCVPVIKLARMKNDSTKI